MNEMMNALLNAPASDVACTDLARGTLSAVSNAHGQKYNIFTGTYFTSSEKISVEVRKSVPRLRALVHFGLDGPFGVPLPLTYGQREQLKLSEYPEIVLWALFARSLELNKFDYELHPSFSQYVAGVLLSERGRRMLDEHSFLLSDYPPQMLRGLDIRSLLWQPLSLSGARSNIKNK